MSVGLIDGSAESGGATAVYFVGVNDGDPEQQVTVCRGCAADMEVFDLDSLLVEVGLLLAGRDLGVDQAWDHRCGARRG